MKIERAFILAAGMGSRLRPYTNDCPKPLVEVGGRSLLERTLDDLESVGVREVVVNTHYLGEQIIERLATRKAPQIHTSQEEDLLDTGGGIKKALHYFKDEPFFVLNGDGLWSNGPAAFKSMMEAWNPDQMDILLQFQPVESMKLTKGVGDYDLLPDAQAVRSLGKTGAHMFTSARINHPRIFDNTQEGAFSYLELMDRAEQGGRLYGTTNTGDWHHISTPEDLERVREAF